MAVCEDDSVVEVELRLRLSLTGKEGLVEVWERWAVVVS